MPPLESKLPAVGTTIFTVMSALAEEHGAINLSQGFPDFDPPAALLDRVAHHLRARHNQYPPMAGVPALREAIAERLARTMGSRRDPHTEITVTSGATEALFCATQAVVHAGEQVIVLDPCYDSYDPAARLAGAEVVHIPLMPPEFVIDWERLESSLGRKTRLIVINSPNNPTGAVLGSEDLDRLAALIRRWGCYVLSDEVYEHIVFDGAGHASVLSHAELAERSFAVFSFGKTYHATGWKVGYCVAPPALTEQLRRVHQFVTFATAAPFQYALADFLRGHPDHDSGLSAFYQQKRDLFVRLLKETGFAVRPARGTYFQLADYSGISELEDQAFSRWLTTRHGVAVIPVSAFYEDPPQARLVRFCFAKQEPTLLEAACRLQAI